MDLLSKIVSGNIDRVKQNIANSFVQDVNIEKGFDDEIEKGKWSVGDTKVYQGATWEVAGFNAKGTPLWRKAKGGSGGSNNSSAAKTSDNSKQNSEDVKNKISNLKNEIEKLRKKHLQLDSEYREAESKSKSGNKYTAGWSLSNLDKIKHDYEENKELLRKKKDILKKLENSINDDDSQQSTSTVSTSSKSDSSKQTNKHSSFVTKTIDKVKHAFRHENIPEGDFEKLADAISNDEETAKKILSAKFPTGGQVGRGLPHSKESNSIDVGGNLEIVFETSKSYTTSFGIGSYTTTNYDALLKNNYTGLKRWLGHTGTSNSGYSKITPSEAKQECIMRALYGYYKRNF